MERLAHFGDFTIIGAGGDMSDWQYIQHQLENQMISEYRNDDGHSLAPEHIHEYLARVMHSRRSKNDPLWNSLVVGGFKNGTSYTLLTAGSWVVLITKVLLINPLQSPLVMVRTSLNQSYARLLKAKKKS